MSEDNETKLCINCKRQISVANFVMHELHCKRHIVLCKHCKEPFARSEVEQHIQDNHTNINCSKCGQEVTKDKLSDHEENSCPKRPMHCTYCELDFPRAELQAHLSFCGSRTEPCVKCGQFIMLKDQNRHDDSNCTYPAPKPAAPVVNDENRPLHGFGRHDPDDALFGTGDMDPFALEELSRMLRPSMADGTGSDYRPANRNAFPPTRKTRKDDRLVNTTNKSNRKSDLNRQRERNTAARQPPSTGTSSGDVDRHLAARLAKDLNELENINDMIHNLRKAGAKDIPGSVGEENSESLNFNTNTDVFPDTSFIPCEFCGEPFRGETLVHHQSVCTLDPMSSLMPQINSDEAGSSIEPWDNRTEQLRPVARQQPAIINNLDPSPDQNWLEEDGSPGMMVSDSTMLPCEFCSELLPMEYLVQHQAMCDANRTVTPAPTASRRPQPKRRLNPNPLDGPGDRLPERTQPTSRSRRHQGVRDVGINLLQNSDDDDDSQPLRRTTQAHSTNRTSNVRNTAVTSRDNRNTFVKRGVQAEDGGSYGSRRKQGSHFSYSPDNEDEGVLAPSGTQLQKSSNQRENTTRTTTTLNDLLLDPEMGASAYDSSQSSFNLLGHMSSNTNRKTAKQEVNSSRQGRQDPSPRNQASVTRPRANRKPTHVPAANSREIQRESDVQNVAAASNRSTRNRTGTGVDPGLSATGGPAPRQRERANHVFGYGGGEAAASNRTNRSTRRTARDNNM